MKYKSRGVNHSELKFGMPPYCKNKVSSPFQEATNKFLMIRHHSLLSQNNKQGERAHTHTHARVRTHTHTHIYI